MRSIKFKFIVAISLLIAGVSFAVSETVKETIPGEGMNANETFLTLGPGLSLYQGNVGWTVNFGVLKGVAQDSNLFWGADLALDFFGGSTNPVANNAGGQVTSSATGIQLLPTAIYRFDLAKAHGIFPYIGLSVGPHIYFSSTNSTVAGVANTSATTVYFELLARPGFFTTISRSVSLDVEAKLGVLGSAFVFLPQANFVFAL